MQLFILCEDCNEELPLRLTANDRGELLRERGEYLQKRCPSCNYESVYHVNEVRARITASWRIAVWIGTALIMVGVYIALYYASDAPTFSELIDANEDYLEFFLLIGGFILGGAFYLQRALTENAARFNAYYC